MCYIRHFRNMSHTFFPFILCNLNFFQGHRKTYLAIQLIYFLKFFFLSIYKKCQKHTKSNYFPVQMPLLDHRILRQSIKNCMCKSTVIIRCEIFCKENGCNSGCHNDRQNHLLYIVCTQSLFMVCKCLRSIFQKRIPAHQTDCYTK